MVIKPTYEEMLDIARETISIFNRNDYDCCLFGSLACVLYGVPDRIPNDVDIIVLTKDNPEYLKWLVCAEDPSCYSLEPSQKPKKKFKKLYYTFPSTEDGPERKCKVDVLVPGKMRIPDMPQRHIMRQGGFPILQILPLLLLKLQGWNDHRHYPFGDYRRKKIPADVDDITGLLEIACNRGTHLGSKSLRWLPEKTVDASRKRVKWYVKKYPESAQKWERLGFDASR